MRPVSSSAAVLFLAVWGCAPKRQTTPPSIPAPLVSALMDNGGSATRAAPMYSVGQLPPDFPAVLVPPRPTRVVGGMTTGIETVAVFADSTRRIAAVMEQLFERHGYVRPRPTPGSGFSSGSGPYSYFCGAGAMVRVEPLAGGNRAFARVTYRRVQDNASCRRPMPAPPAEGLVLPELKPPTGVRVSRSSGGSEGDEVNSSAEVVGVDLSAPAIVAHYAAQLTGAGWTAEMPAIGQRVAAQYFEATDTAGQRWDGVLMAAGGDTVLTISLNMRRRAPR